MDQYKIYRVETDGAGVVAHVVVACCKQGEEFYAEYFVLYELLRSNIFHSWHDSKQMSAKETEKILNFALELAKERMTSEGLGDIKKKQLGHSIALGDDQDIDVLKGRHRAEMNQLCAELKCQCLKDLLK